MPTRPSPRDRCGFSVVGALSDGRARARRVGLEARQRTPRERLAGPTGGNDMIRIQHPRLRPLPCLAAALAFAAASAAWAAKPEVELDEAEVFIEWNSTDTDFGIQFFWDGEPWTKMNVMDPTGKKVLKVGISGAVRAQGLTEGFFESAEPPAAVLPMDAFLARFPEGEYTFWGQTQEKESLVGETDFTHVLPAPPTNLSPEEDDVVSHMGFEASFDPVTTDSDGNPLAIELYEVVIEKEDDDPILQVFSVILPPSQTSVMIPEEFLEPDTEYKLEVIAQEESGNRTISETGPFTTTSD
jgi:hypothetical protein